MYIIWIYTLLKIGRHGLDLYVTIFERLQREFEAVRASQTQVAFDNISGEDPDFEYIQVRGGGQIVLKGLYSGFAGNLAGVLPYVTASAIFIGVYEPNKQKLLKSWPENFNALAHLTTGAVGDAASSIIRVPTKVVTQRMQTGHFASAPVAVRLIVAKEGFKGIFVVCHLSNKHINVVITENWSFISSVQNEAGRRYGLCDDQDWVDTVDRS
ncbi:S-adenosylmethionine carrier 1, chloroplastic/mitochondrial-like protein [Tanacetum coccineum]